MPNAAMAKAARKAGAALRPAAASEFKRAGEREGLILHAPNLFVQKSSCSETGIPPSHKNSNNPLAVEPETENDAGRLNFFAGPFEISLRLKRRLADEKDLFK